MRGKERAENAFRDTFGEEPDIVASAPGRVNLIGEHTDYSGGLVLPMVLPRECVVAAGRGGKAGVCVAVASDLSQRAMLTLGAAEVSGAVASGQGAKWTDYVQGVLEMFRCAGGKVGAPIEGLRLAIASDVPLGSGLASSAALEVACMRALRGLTGAAINDQQVADLCRRAEHEYAGVPCGIMDQWASSMGRPGEAMLIDCRPPARFEAVAMPPVELGAIVVFDTGVRHSNASGEYGQRVAVCGSAARKLGVAWLADATDEQVRAMRGRLTDEELRVCRHVVGENGRVRGFVEAMGRGDARGIGRLLDQSHRSLRDDYRVSCPELETVVGAARSSAGCLGARLVGAGLGGCAIALVEPGRVGAVVEAVSAAYLARHRRECASMVAWGV